MLARTASSSAPLDDTMLMSYALDGGRGQHGMDDLAERHLGHACIPFEQVLEHAPGAKKSDKTFAQVPLDKATEYAAEDADVTLRLWMVLKPRLAAERMTTRLRDAGAAAVPGPGAHGARRHQGRPADPVAAVQRRSRKRVARLEEEINGLVGHKFNLGSPRQLGEFLFDRLKLPGGKRTKTGAVGDAAPVCSMISRPTRNCRRMRAAHQYDARVAAADEAAVDLHGCAARLRQSRRRAASTPPTRWLPPRRDGSPRPIRTCRTFRSAPRRAARSAPPSSPTQGTKLISADYSQIELRVLAHIADIPQLQQGVRRRPRHPRHDGIRDVRRADRRACRPRCAGAPRRSTSASSTASPHSASPTSSASRARRPAITSRPTSSASPASATTWTRRRSVAHERGFVETIFGRRIHYPEINTKNPGMRGFLERAAINAPIQGSAADIIRRAMIRMDARPGGSEARAHACSCRCTTSSFSRSGRERRPQYRSSTRDGGSGAAGRFAQGADPRRRQGRRQLGSGALSRKRFPIGQAQRDASGFRVQADILVQSVDQGRHDERAAGSSCWNRCAWR